MIMKPGGTPAFRAAATSILKSFLNTTETAVERKAEVNFLKVDIDPILAKKRHLIITGSRRSGKSTLLREILTLPDFPADTISSEISESLRNSVSADSSLPGSCLPVFHGLRRHISDIPFLPGQAESRLQMFPGFTTHAFKQDRVELTDNLTRETSRIGIYRPKFSFHAFPADSDSGKSAASSASSGNQMVPDLNGFLGGGLASIKRAIDSPAAFAVIDELGYLESSCPEFCDAIFHLFDTKRVIAVLRSQSTPFLDALRARDDVYVYDLDHPVLPVGCVIMASGLGKRFGSNKLMADFNGKPLITRILSATDGPLFAARIVVTRSPEVESLCREREIPVLLHTMPYRNHTVKLGLSALLGKNPDLAGCIFALGDQPLLSQETIEAMVLTFATQAYRSCGEILRLASMEHGEVKSPGNPILFDRRYFNELLTLPDNSGGNVLLKKYPQHVRYFPAASPLELADADTPEELEYLKNF